MFIYKKGCKSFLGCVVLEDACGYEKTAYFSPKLADDTCITFGYNDKHEMGLLAVEDNSVVLYTNTDRHVLAVFDRPVVIEPSADKLSVKISSGDQSVEAYLNDDFSFEIDVKTIKV